MLTHLLPIINSHVAPGTIIHSDEWRAYNHVSTLPNVCSHATVNHSVTFVAPNGTHTQHIESYWNWAKVKLKRMKGCQTEQIPSYLDEFMWCERFRNTDNAAWINIILHISQQYPV